MKLAISPCPNDTFIFYHLIQKRENLNGMSLEAVFADVEDLNYQAIKKQSYAITKLSFAAMYYARENYELLNCGGAMGYNCGPLLLSREDMDLNDALPKMKLVAVPGHWTSAKALLDIFLEEKKVKEGVEFISMPYDKIIPALQNKSMDFGVVIHEERFSFKRKKLHKIQDLGAWWQSNTQLPIPLGCIAIRKDLPPKIRKALEEEIPKSLQYARENMDKVWPFIKSHAQTIDESIIQAHIDLYVNDFTLDFGKEGQKAIQEFFKRIDRTM